jgi:thiol:disulfide interchange protein DsbD
VGADSKGNIDTNQTAEILNEKIEKNITPIHKQIKDKEVVIGQGHKKEERSMLTIFILSFLSGLAALLTPCVFPMIPMTVSYFTKQSKSRIQGIKNAFLYSLSIITIYILLGTVVTRVFGAEVLNEMSTNPTFNIIFFFILAIFAISFLGAFEIRMPNSWLNKADKASDKGGVVGIFFMALALALVSFSCTGPIVGTLLVEAASIGGIAPFIGMFGFSVALALPFGLFAAFPGWMNSLPKSGGWLNSVKVVLGFLELALAFKFLSNADLAVQGHFLERELFLAIWIGIFGVLALYLFGFIKLPHDSPLERLSVGRTLFGTFVFVFVIYMIPGMFGAPLKLISAFPPPSSYSESPLGIGGNGHSSENIEIIEGTHLGPQGLMVFDDYDLAFSYSQKVGKPLFVDFTGHNCVNCRKMEESVWGEPGIIESLKDKVVIVSLHVDERLPLPKSEQKVVELVPGNKKLLQTTGDKWMYMQINKYKAASQPYYVMLGPDGKDLPIGSADYEHHSNPKDFKKWIDKGLELYNK